MADPDPTTFSMPLKYFEMLRHLQEDPQTPAGPVDPATQAAAADHLRALLRRPPKAPDVPLPKQGPLDLFMKGATAASGLLGINEPERKDFLTEEDFQQAGNYWGVPAVAGVLLGGPGAMGAVARGLGAGKEALTGLTAGREALTAAEEAAPAVRQGIKVYHGSGADFDAFDPAFVGSGEGSQYRGMGHYLAEAEPTAKRYREIAGRGQYPPEEIISRYYKPGEIVESYGGGRDRVLEYCPSGQRGWRVKVIEIDPKTGEPKPWVEARTHMTAPTADEANKAFAARGEEPWVPGHSYEASLKAHPDEFLDWDIPLAEHPPAVTERARAAVDSKYGPGTFDEMAKNGADVHDLLRNFDDMDKGEMEQLLQGHGVAGTRFLDKFSRGGQDVPQLQAHVDQVKARIREFEGVAANPASYFSSKENYAEHMAKLQGYLKEAEDDLARVTSGTKTRNYTIFHGNEHLIEIMRKYGVTLPVAAEMYRRQQAQTHEPAQTSSSPFQLSQ